MTQPVICDFRNVFWGVKVLVPFKGGGKCRGGVTGGSGQERQSGSSMDFHAVRLGGREIGRGGSLCKRRLAHLSREKGEGTVGEKRKKGVVRKGKNCVSMF